MPSRRGLLQLSLYAQHLGTGSTIMCRTIKVDTIKKYILSVAQFLSLFGDHPRDFRKECQTSTTVAVELTKVYAELARWEKVPNRREPFTLEMLMDMHENFASSGLGPDSLLAALVDWFEVGLFAGSRLSEWAQDAYHEKINNYKKDVRDETRAFTLLDFRFEDGNRGRYSALEASKADVPMAKCWTTYRTQKNGQNGEERLQTRNPRTGGKCFVSAILRIIRRFTRLVGETDTTTPLSVYQCPARQEILLITSIDIEKEMRSVAARVYKLDPIKDAEALQRWSSHSLRVGACVILHSMGITETQLKWLLRWRSDAFMVYLRNTAILANAQYETLDKASAMPHFL